MVGAMKKSAMKQAKKPTAPIASSSKVQANGKPAKKAQPASKAPVKLVEADVEEEAGDESEWSSEDEDEENGGVSSKGMKRLMQLVGPEDLEEHELVMLGGSNDEDEDDEEGDEVEDDEDEEDVENDDEEEEDDENEDEEDLPLDNSVLIAEADEDALDLDDVGSDVSVDEDAVPARKVTIDNKPALRLLTEKISLTKQPWPEHLILTTKETVDVDPSDDLKREMAFYKLALEAVAPARKLCRKHDIPFDRPSDYYAEMVKSDEHMERVRTKLVDEATTIKKSEAARRQRELKKFGKQIQQEKIKQREQDKKSFNERVQGIKRKRKDGMDLGDDDGDEFGIEVDDDGPAAGGGRGGPSGRGQQRKMPRSARDAKYSLGGGGKRSKQNTRESTMDFGGGGFGGGRGGGRGGRGGGKAGRGGARPGKSRRHK